MVRIVTICEGDTEAQFIKKVVAPYLAMSGIFISGRLLGRPGHKGGNVRFDRLSRDIRNTMYSDKESFCTTFFDFYGLAPDFPGKEEATKKATIKDKAAEIKRGLRSKLQSDVGEDRIRFFIPYVQMYEFEALLFSDPETFAAGINQTIHATKFKAVRDEFANPEEINDSFETAPSKRIQKLVSTYQKPTDGLRAAEAIGLATIRAECSLFDAWLTSLEDLKT